MLEPFLFAVYVTVFVTILYAAEHFVSTRLSALQARDSDEHRPSQKAQSH